MRSRAMHRRPRTTTTVERFTVRDELGNVLADNATTRVIKLNGALCPNNKPRYHVAGTLKEVCNHCSAVS